MAKKSKGGKGSRRGPAKEIKQTGTGGVSRTSAGKKHKPVKGGGAKAALSVPGATTGRI